MTTQAQYASVPRCAMAQVSAANTNRDGTGTIVTVFTAGANGSRIERVVVQAVATTTAGMVRLFINDGTNARLYEEVPIFANTPSATVPAAAATLEAFSLPTLYPIVIPNGFSLSASTNNAEVFNIIAIGGDF
jgi:hypothetical protein